MDKELERVEVVNINYTRPKFWHRVMANFVDFFIFLVTLLGLFIASRAIVQSTPSYKASINRLSEIQLSSGLYVKDINDPNKNLDVVSYLDKYVQVYGNEFDGGEDAEGKNGKAVNAINSFIAYCNDRFCCYRM